MSNIDPGGNSGHEPDFSGLQQHFSQQQVSVSEKIPKANIDYLMGTFYSETGENNGAQRACTQF
jgi:hypothetical protein